MGNGARIFTMTSNIPETTPKIDQVLSILANRSSGIVGGGDSDAVIHVTSFMDALRWFRESKIDLSISPSEGGWDIKFSVRE